MGQRTITVVGARGGHGATTVAAALAVYAAGHVPTRLVAADTGTAAARLGRVDPPTACGLSGPAPVGVVREASARSPGVPPFPLPHPGREKGDVNDTLLGVDPYEASCTAACVDDHGIHHPNQGDDHGIHRLDDRGIHQPVGAGER